MKSIGTIEKVIRHATERYPEKKCFWHQADLGRRRRGVTRWQNFQKVQNGRLFMDICRNGRVGYEFWQGARGTGQNDIKIWSSSKKRELTGWSLLKPTSNRIFQVVITSLPIIIS